ncbi:hypothetical protein F5884DRAFT_682177, partial [Xylogone sp. PMI_703]
IQHKVLQLVQLKEYDDETREAIRDHLFSNANGTFLWDVLVCQVLEKTPEWEILATLNTLPPRLDALYERMINRIRDSVSAALYRWVLATIAPVYRPITLQELITLTEGLQSMPRKLKLIEKIVYSCGSFISIRDGTIYFMHQSAKDYMISNKADKIFLTGKAAIHYAIFSRSLHAISQTLHRDIYKLRSLGYPIERVKQPDPDPLAMIRYSCIHWVDHLYHSDVDKSKEYRYDLQEGGAVDNFLRRKYLYWIEALSLLQNMSYGVHAMIKLEGILLKVSLDVLRWRGSDTNSLGSIHQKFIMWPCSRRAPIHTL